MKCFFTICFLLFIIPNESKSQTVEVPFTDLYIGCSVKDGFNSQYNSNIQSNPNNIIIRNKEELNRLKNCPEDYLFDFNKYIIIGIIGEIGGCNSPIVSFKVIKEPDSKKYVIESTILQRGLCRMIFYYQRFITIEKPEENYSFEFKTIKDLYTKGDSPSVTIPVIGIVTNHSTNEKLAVLLTVEDSKTGELIISQNSNSNSGEYILELPVGKSYIISTTHENYFYYSDKLEIPLGSENKIIKNIELKPLLKGEKAVLANICFGISPNRVPAPLG